jgi:hypothetical protein
MKNERFSLSKIIIKNKGKNGGSKEEDDFEDEDDDEDGGDPFVRKGGGRGLVQTDRETVKIFTGEEKVTHGWVEERFNRAIEECDSIVVVKGKRRRRRSRENDDDEREDDE